MLNYQRIAQASLMGPGGMPLSMYNSAAYAEGLPAAAYMPGVGPEQFHYVSRTSIIIFLDFSSLL